MGREGRRGTPARSAIPIVVAAVAVACSALDLTDGLEPAPCDGVSETCEDLNVLYPTDDACLRWTCDPTIGYCAVRAADLDDDGAPAAGCGEAPEHEDCDDTDPSRFPGNTETCDGVDNDCDGVVDLPSC